MFGLKLRFWDRIKGKVLDKITIGLGLGWN